MFPLFVVVPWLLAALLAVTFPFPRGPGFYYSPVKLLLAAALFFAWLRTCSWVDRDAIQLELKAAKWNGVLFAAGVVGLLALWVLPYFWLALLLFATLYAGVTLTYVGTRNEKVVSERRVLTWEHLRSLSQGLLNSESNEQTSSRRVEGGEIRLQFVGKSMGEAEVDDQRVDRAEESDEYQSALSLVQEAIQARTTDIHLEPTRDTMLVRFRIDGILHRMSPFSRETGDSVLNIFKVLANLDIAERRKPQDGSFAAVYTGPVDGASGEFVNRMIDFRVATAGSVAGEKLVVRLLDRAIRVSSLADIGMREKYCRQVQSIVGQPHGMFLVCGPTGAGKSTTLYVCLSQIDQYQRNVITLENPVEYRIENATQIEVNAKAGKTFASELRSILRQDPDVIYIGEIRDKETAEIACQAAQTGHMVFTTLHANDTVTALTRLLDLEVPPYLVASAVSGILGQRLVRLLCPECKQKYKPDPELIRKANIPSERVTFFYKANEVPEDERDGDVCANCGGTGYRGRTGIFELLVVNDTIRGMLRKEFDVQAIRQEAIKMGMKQLQENGLRLVIDGKTSINELLRVSK